MAGGGGLTSQPLDPGHNFNWIWLVELLVCGILVLFFLFYFNRLFATLISYGVRAYTWHKFRVYIDIQALQISLLGGRIFFKGIRYHGQNETIFIQNGYVTWQYWLLSVKQVDLVRYESEDSSIAGSDAESAKEKPKGLSENVSDTETGGIKEAPRLPSRIAVSVSGLEWFVYNRSPVYDAIVGHGAELDGNGPESEGQTSSHASGTDFDRYSKAEKVNVTRAHASSNEAPSSKNSKSDTSWDKESLKENTNHRSPTGLESIRTNSTNASDPSPTESAPPLILRILPVWIECHKGAIVLGNDTTKSILSTTFDSAQGHIDASSSSPRDVFRQIFDFQIDHPVVQMKPNADFSQLQRAAAEQVLFDSDPLPPKRKWWLVDFHLQRRKRKAIKSLRNLVPYFQKSVESFHAVAPDERGPMRAPRDGGHDVRDGPWLGLGRYLEDDEHDDHAGWTNIDYAKFSTVLDCPSILMNFYWDTPGKVTMTDSRGNGSVTNQDINGSDPPAYGLDLVIRGGSVDYGPWTDRLRAELQNVFLPNPFQNAEPAQKLRPGSFRQSTVMKIHIAIEQEVSLRVPTRENSKDWQWKGRAGALRGAKGLKKHREKKHFRLKKGEKGTLGPDVRPFGWLMFHIDPNSTVTYEMDMVPGKSGYSNHLDLDLKGTRATSSVNHALLWRCGPQKMSCDLSNPLGWNDFHRWSFSIHSHAMEFFLLRDHMFLLTDLISDFTSSSDIDYMSFVPFEYDIELNFTDMKVYLNTNDANIIDNPCDMDENSFLILGFQNLQGNVDIPMRNFSPVQNSVLFKAEGHNVSLELSTPLWNTLHTFVSDHPLAVLKDLTLDGSYNFNLSPTSKLTDTLFMNISGMSPKVYLHGFLIKYFMKMRDNYFGDFLHFKTQEEYQETSSNAQTVGNDHPHTTPQKDDELDVILNVRADRSCALLPANIYSRKDNVHFDILLVEADMRFTNFYMDLSVKSSPIEASLESLESEEVGASGTVSNTQLFVDGISAYGHRLFGAPPSEPTYVCNWDFDVGKISGECSCIFLRTLATAGVSFAFTLDDDENTIPMSNIPIIHDITFLRARVESINLWFLIEDAALLLQTGLIDVSFNDWAGVYFSERVHVSVPDIVIAAIDQKDAARHRGAMDVPVKTYACFETSVDLKLVERKPDFSRDRKLQQHHVRFHDQRTRRVDWLLHQAADADDHREKDRYKGAPPSMPVPTMPEPVTESKDQDLSVVRGTAQLEKGSFPRRQSSFLSLSSSKRSIRQDSKSKITSDGKSEILSRSRSQGGRFRPSLRDTNHPVRSTGGESKHSSPGPSSATAAVTFSSPWASPRFPLQKARLDKIELPKIPSTSGPPPHSRPGTVDQDPFIKSDESPRTAHLSFLIEARPGLTGFCTPQLFGIISKLIRQLQPRHPIDFLDQIQIDTMSKILKLAKIKSKAQEVMDFRIHVPFFHLRMINMFEPEQESSQQQLRDQYDLISSQLRTTFRLYDHTEGDILTPDTNLGLLIHTQANEVCAAVTGKSAENSNDMASAQVSVSDISFWLGSHQQLNAKLQVRSIEAITSGRQIRYLASLIHRTGVVVEHIVDDFKMSDQAGLLQHVVYHLTTEGAQLADPVFLTKPSYVLRSAGDHLRQSDSWKLISRLRFMYRSLPKATQEWIVAGVAGRHQEFPDDAERHVLASFDQWRNWDHGNVQTSFLMERIWGRTAALPAHRNSQPIHGEFLVGSIRFLLDPGPRQNECIVGDIDITVSSTNKLHADTHVVQAGNMRQQITVQVYCSQFAMHLNWDLVDLVGDTVIRFQSQDTGPSDDVPNLQPQSSADVVPQSMEVHFVLGTDIGSITMDSHNLTLKTAAEKLQVSAIYRANPEADQVLNLILSANSALAKVSSKKLPILGWKLSLPVIHASQTSKNRIEEIPNDLRLAGMCQKLRFDLKEDTSEVLAIVQRVIGTEVELVHNFLSRVQRPTAVTLRNAPERKTRPLNIHVALFLNDYKLNFRLLPSLIYSISGEVARTSVRPGYNSTVQVDLDLKRHYHSFHIVNAQGRTNISTLGMPPINGRVFLKGSGPALSVDVEITFETIKLEAADVRSCFDTVTRPDMAKLIMKVKQGIQEASDRIDAIFVSTKSPVDHKDKQPPLPVRYTARVNLLGLIVHCSAPGLKSRDYRADLEFHLGPTTAHLHNHTTEVEVTHEQPQFDVQIQQIGLELGRRSDNGISNFGKLSLSAHATGATEADERGNNVQDYRASVDQFIVDLFPETPYLILEVAAFLQERIKSLTVSQEVKQLRPLRRLTVAGLSDRSVHDASKKPGEDMNDETASNVLLGAVYSLDLNAIQVKWVVLNQNPESPTREQEDLVFSIRKIDLTTKREGSARLAIMDLQLQMVPKSMSEAGRSANSALLPEVVFKVAHLSTKHDRRFAFQAAGKALDLRLASDFIVPASVLQQSLGSASEEMREAKAFWASLPAPSRKESPGFMGAKRLSSLLVDADFAGAVVNIQPRRAEEHRESVFGILKGSKRSRGGRYGQAVSGEGATEAVLRAPGVAFKVEYRDAGTEDPTLSAEVKVAASSNVLYPSVVPLIIEVSSSIKEIVGDSDATPISAPPAPQPQTQWNLSDASMSGDPATILGRCKLNVGLWISKQEFSLSCQPIARVAATARFDSIFMTVNTVQSPTEQRFFALLVNFNKLQASVQHVYSRESTASFDVESIVVSLMNSKHVTTNTGLSAILNVSPMNTAINAKQLQDFLLFREIWYPTELRQNPAAAPPTTKTTKSTDTQAYVVQRYQQVAAASAFPWNAVISIQELKVQLDLGQGLGKSLFKITKLWASTKKSSDWEQNLCLGFDKIGVESTGRMSGFIELQNFRVRTSIRWPLLDKAFKHTPLVQASLGLDELRVKAAFDYQPFAVADISTLEFLMYNVRSSEKGEKDRLVGILDGDKVQVFCTTGTASQGLALYQAVERLIQEKEADYEASLRELDRYLRRKSVFPSSTWTDRTSTTTAEEEEDSPQSPISLHTDVVVTLRSINIGAFPSTFFDNQILKVEATDAQARFAVSAKNDKTHSGLGLTLGQLRVALSNVDRPTTQALGDVSVAEIVSRATGSRGGTILKVPKVVVTMQTWQTASSNHIEYIFKSTFEGKIDVGWNYSRISFIRGMWSAHVRALAHRLGKPLPQSAVKITGGPQPGDPTGNNQGQEKITAVVNVPQSKFEYTALEPPIIDTPQLRDMGEATPPLEWIGLHRDRLPNVTHQIIIVTLLEVAQEVETAYNSILGSST